MSLGYHLTARANSWLPARPSKADRSGMANLSLEEKPAFAVSPTSQSINATTPNLKAQREGV